MPQQEPDERRAAKGAIDSSRPTGKGTVYKKLQGYYCVNAGGRSLLCTISSTLRKNLEYPVAAPWSLRPRVVAVHKIRAVDPVAIGDIVRFTDSGDDTGMIVEVLPRRNSLVRRAAGRKMLQQVIVVNVDQVVVVFAATRPAPNWEALDRYLAAAESTGLPARVVITKMDLVEVASVEAETGTYRRAGYPVLLTSAAGGVGIEAFREALHGRASVIAGPSGVGKTSLLNAIQPGLGLRVGEVSKHTNKGMHTTSHLEMFPLDGGGSVVDTPGMRELGLWDVEPEEIDGLFPEMRPYLGFCRFRLDCSHTHEPGCAVKEAVARGAISERRYRSCLSMKE